MACARLLKGGIIGNVVSKQYSAPLTSSSVYYFSLRKEIGNYFNLETQSRYLFIYFFCASFTSLRIFYFLVISFFYRKPSHFATMQYHDNLNARPKN